jgi:hypothetical protein
MMRIDMLLLETTFLELTDFIGDVLKRLSLNVPEQAG